MGTALWLLAGLPLAGGLGLLVGARRLDRSAAAVAAGICSIGLVLAIAVSFGNPSVSVAMFVGIPAGLAVDGLSAVLVITVSVVALAVVTFSAGDLGPDQSRARYYGLILIFVAGMLITVTATNLLVLLASWEVMGAMSYALIGFWWTDPARARSASLAFLTTRSADLGMYLAAGAALAGGVGTLSLAALPDAARPWLHVLTAGLILAAVGKSAQLPFSFWLSGAMSGPSPVSALLHSATMVAAGGYLLLRLQPLLSATVWAGPTVAWIGVGTAVLMGAVALAQTDLKQLLAASTCSQIGFIVLAAGVGAVSGGTLQLIAHAATKSLLFLGAGAWLSSLGTKDLRELRGVARRYPVVGITFSIGALSLAGVAPLSIWVAKDEVLAAASARSAGLYVAGLVAAVLGALYAGKALAVVWAPSSTQPEAAGAGHAGSRSVSRWMRLPLPILALGAAALGALALPPLAGPLRAGLGATGEPEPTLPAVLLSAGLAIGGLAIGAAAVASGRTASSRRATGLRAGRRVGSILEHWLHLEPLAMRVVAAPAVRVSQVLAAFDDRVVGPGAVRVAARAVRVSRALAAFDDRVVDGGVVGVAAWGRAVSRLSTVRAEAAVDRVVRAVGSGTGWLGGVARRPQTGQLHQYYAQAVAVFAVLALGLVLVR